MNNTPTNKNLPDQLKDFAEDHPLLTAFFMLFAGTILVIPAFGMKVAMCIAGLICIIGSIIYVICKMAD